jgi:hypothetical protein
VRDGLRSHRIDIPDAYSHYHHNGQRETITSNIQIRNISEDKVCLRNNSGGLELK